MVFLLVQALWLAGLHLLPAPTRDAAPPTPPQQIPAFRTGVELVRLDVSVLDANRRPVLGLRAEDFSILVDGVSQPIVAVEPVVMPPQREATAAWLREAPQGIRTNAVDQARIFIIVMDDVATIRDPFEVRTGREIGHALVDQLVPGDVAAVLFTDPIGRRNSQPLTND